MEIGDLFTRFLQAFDYLKDKGVIHNQQDLADKLNMPKSSISLIMKNDPKRFTKGFIRRFISTFSDIINEEWLVSGKGEVGKILQFKVDNPDSYAKLARAIISSKLQEISKPHISQKASAGFMDLINIGDEGKNRKPYIPFIGDYDFTIEVQGESMIPDFKDGDIVACKFITDRFDYPIGHACVLDCKDGVLLKVVKNIEVTNDGSIITLHSLNPKYKDFTISEEEVNHIALVIGSIRSF